MGAASNRLKPAAIIVAALLIVAFYTPLVPEASASPTAIASLTPKSGAAGATIRIIGEIDTPGGTYQIWWDGETPIEEGNCSAGSTHVDDNFTVPSDSSQGSHTVVLVDLDSTVESESAPFVVTPPLSYSLYMVPSRVQEGGNVALVLDVLGAGVNSTYGLNMTVLTPAAASHTTHLSFSTDDTGSGLVSATYWQNFSSANTDLVGVYMVAVNGSLATGNFTVGLTDKTEYQTGETVYIRGAGYQSHENVTVSLKMNGAQVTGYSKTVTADGGGVVADSWNISEDAAAGSYIVTLGNSSASGTVKEEADSQVFTVTSIYRLQTLNLDGRPVENVSVELYNATANSLLSSQATNGTGWVVFALSRGNYTFRAFWGSVEVGHVLNQSFSETVTRVLAVSLSSIKITVRNETGAALPSIGVALNYNYTNRSGSTLPATVTLSTDSRGVAAVNNTLALTRYVVELRRDGYLFSRSTIPSLASAAQLNVTCPSYNLQLSVLDSKGRPLRNVQATLIESGSGSAAGTGITSASGNASFRLLLGRYMVNISNYTAKLGYVITLNETAVGLSRDQFLSVRCIAFNLDFSVRIVDYFGHPVPNAAVDFECNGIKVGEGLVSGSNGSVLLPNTVGGDYRVSVRLGGKLVDVESLRVAGPTAALFALSGYVLVAGYPLEVGQFITLVSLCLLLLAFAVVLARHRLMRLFRRMEEAAPARGEGKAKR